MIYTLDEIARRIRPVAEKYCLKAVYVFGSYARGEARADSDIDLLVDTNGANLKTLFALEGLYSDLKDALEKLKKWRSRDNSPSTSFTQKSRV